MLERDDGTFRNVLLIDKRNIHNNRLQVSNQYEVDADAAAHATRYDVTILVNGLPLVHVELKRRGGGVGAAALCGGGGQGDALIVRVPQG